MHSTLLAVVLSYPTTQSAQRRMSATSLGMDTSSGESIRCSEGPRRQLWYVTDWLASAPRTQADDRDDLLTIDESVSEKNARFWSPRGHPNVYQRVTGGRRQGTVQYADTARFDGEFPQVNHATHVTCSNRTLIGGQIDLRISYPPRGVRFRDLGLGVPWHRSIQRPSEIGGFCAKACFACLVVQVTCHESRFTCSTDGVGTGVRCQMSGPA